MSHRPGDEWGSHIPALAALKPEMERAAATLDASATRPGQHGRRGRVEAGAALMATIVVVIVVVVLMVRSAGAIDVRRCAAAAEKAGTFTFASTSDLSFADGMRQSERQSGAVDLTAPGYLARSTAGAQGSGFERLVFLRALYVRGVGGQHPDPWREIRLSPSVEIAPKIGGSDWISDPLGLLAVLRESNGAKKIGPAQIGGVTTTQFRLQTTLAPFLQAEGISAPAAAGRDPVRVDVWLDDANRVIRTQQLFDLGGPRGVRLLVTTDFRGYGSSVELRPPPDRRHTGVVWRLNPVTSDPLSGRVLSTLLNSAGHPNPSTLERFAP
jgi:hypothetical protein